MTELTLNNLTEDFVMENLEEETEDQVVGNTLQQVLILHKDFKVGEDEVSVSYRPSEEEPWFVITPDVYGPTGKGYKTFTGVRNNIKRILVS